MRPGATVEFIVSDNLLPAFPSTTFTYSLPPLLPSQDHQKRPMFPIFTPRILLLCAIFSRSLLFATAQPRAYCSHDSVDRHNATLADCYAAIDMIPPGGYAPAPPQVTNQPGIWIPQDVRDPKRFHIPASFWSGTCEVHVACRFPNVSKPRFPPGADFASFQYNTVWPNARRMARRIVDKCFPTSKTGFDEGSGTIAFEAIKSLQ